MTQYKELLREAKAELENWNQCLEPGLPKDEETIDLVARIEAALAQPEQDDEGDAEVYAHRKDGPKPGEPFGETAVYESRTDHLAGRRSCACRGGK